MRTKTRAMRKAQMAGKRTAKKKRQKQRQRALLPRETRERRALGPRRAVLRLDLEDADDVANLSPSTVVLTTLYIDMSRDLVTYGAMSWLFFSFTCMTSDVHRLGFFFFFP